MVEVEGVVESVEVEGVDREVRKGSREGVVRCKEWWRKWGCREVWNECR